MVLTIPCGARFTPSAPSRLSRTRRMICFSWCPHMSNNPKCFFADWSLPSHVMLDSRLQDVWLRSHTNQPRVQLVIRVRRPRHQFDGVYPLSRALVFYPLLNWGDQFDPASLASSHQRHHHSAVPRGPHHAARCFVIGLSC